MPKDRLGRYDLERSIGRGGMSEVWKAWDASLNRHVAVKILKNADDEDLARFQREATIVANLRHPNIAPLYELARDGDRCFIAMQLIEGSSLDRLEAPLRRNLEIVRDAARALHFAHRQGIVHRDVKPSNIMVEDSGRVFVLDFGIARPTKKGATVTSGNVVVGTPAFMAPEQARGDKPDARADVYSLGATLYRLAVHIDPFYGDDPLKVVLKVLNEDPPRPRTLEPDLPREVEHIIRIAMDKDPARRFQTAEEMAREIDAYLAGRTVRAPKRRLRVPWLAWVMLLALPLGAWLLVRPTPQQPPPPDVRPSFRIINDAHEILMQLATLEPTERNRLARDVVARLNKITETDPSFSDALIEVARIETMVGHLPEAEHAADRALQTDTHNALAYLLRGRLKLKRALSEKSAQLAKFRSQSGTTWVQLAELLKATAHDTPQVRELLNQSTADLEQFRRALGRSLPAETAFAGGLLAFTEGRYDEATKKFTESSASPYLAQDARLLLAFCRYLLGDADRAEAALSKAGDGDDVVELRLSLAMYLYLKGLQAWVQGQKLGGQDALLKRNFIELFKLRPKVEDWDAVLKFSSFWREYLKPWVDAAKG